jgi:hypothetical protein
MACVRAFAGASSLFMATMAIAAPAAAQVASVSQKTPTARETEIDLGADFTYDSNVARSDREIAARRGLALADEIATPSVNIILARPFGRTMLFLNAAGSYDFYRVNTRRDHEQVALHGGASGHFGPCRETVTGDYALYQSDLTDIAANLVNNVREDSDVQFAAECGRSVGLAPQVSVEQSWISNSAVQLKTVDSNSLTVSAGLAYRRPVLGALTLFGEYIDGSYPNRSSLQVLLGLATGYQVYAGGVRYERHIGPRIDAAASLSYTALNPSTGGASRFRGLTYTADVVYRFTTRLTFHANAERATLPSNRIFANYRVDETYGADVSYMISPRLTLKLSGDRRHASYQGASLLAVQSGDLTVETIYTAQATATYNLTKRFSFILNVGDEERETDVPGLSYSSTRVSIGARAKF